MKRILGLDLGTNSVGWALIVNDFQNNQGEILGIGSRIIPMSQEIIGNFDSGNSVSQTAERTGYRGVRRLRERQLLRRQRLHRVLNVLGFLPEHYAKHIDFQKRPGQFIDDTEPKIAWKKNALGNYEFIFKDSFNEMLDDFKKNGQTSKIPYDWTIFYLRKKALSNKISKEELAWLILNFNQKRGYYQLRGEEEEENSNKIVEYHSLKVVDVVSDGAPNSKGDIWYSLHLENGWIYRRSSKIPMDDWKDKVRDFIVTTELDKDGNVAKNKDGNEKRSFRAPSEGDWLLLKKKTESEIEHSRKTVGAYIYDNLIINPSQKINGKLVRTVERKFYKRELIEILKKQIELQPELFTEELYIDCVRELYRSNEEHQFILSKKDFLHLLVEDIIFYQRPLRSQKSSIGNCSFEYQKYKDKDGNEIKSYIKATPKSNPYFQEFRIWQWMYNLKIVKCEDDENVTDSLIGNTEDKEALFSFLNSRKEIDQSTLLQFLLKRKDIKDKKAVEKYRWNYVEDKRYPCNETVSDIVARLNKVVQLPANFLTPEMAYRLWHIIYSVTDKVEFESALRTFAMKHALHVESFVDAFKKMPPYKSDYAQFSEKAIKKLLPLMRIGNYWQYESIDLNTRERIEKIITGECDETISNKVRDEVTNLKQESDFQGLPLYLAQYVVYNRHSEPEKADRWSTIHDLEKYIADFKQHSLRNPIVEQVILETLRVVRDIWTQFGHGERRFFDEIHVELGRELKKTADERKRITERVRDNENTNIRIKALLAELSNDSKIESVRPNSPYQQELLKIYEEYVLSTLSDDDVDKDFVMKMSKTPLPTSSELNRYKLWLEQKYRSPYTGQIIPLNKLFTDAYQIEHVIPQSRYFDDSYSNKVICESAVNKLKDKQLGLEFIKNHHGEIVETGFGQSVKILELEAYTEFVKQNYRNNRLKRDKLLMEDIPEKMIERQLNDTRHISKLISQVLSNIVREDSNDEGLNSKNLIPVTGQITTQLKKDWGLNGLWSDLVLPRFERMNQLTESNLYTTWNENLKKFLPTVPLAFSKGFQIKRIDHRHHAMDALVIACTTRDHVNLLNNQAARSNSEFSRYDLQFKLREREDWVDNNRVKRVKFGLFKKPWDNFYWDAKTALEHIVVSFKQNLRVINKATNKYTKYLNGKKVKETQHGVNWAIRKPLHKETVFARIAVRKVKTVRFSEAIKDWKNIVDKELKKEIKNVIALYSGQFDEKTINNYFKTRKYKFNDVDISKVEVYYFDQDISAVRKPIDSSFTEKKIMESVADSGIQKILINHLYANANDPNVAFSPEGIEEMNKNIVQLNDGKFHQPINKVRVTEILGNKFPVGQSGNKNVKYVEAAKGTNLYFAIYVDENGKRTFDSVPLNIVVERLKGGLSPVPEHNEKGDRLLFYLSPNDLVYLPESDEQVQSIKRERIYKMVSCTGSRSYFIGHNVANSIIDKVEFTALNKMERAITGEMIKETCVKLKVDRLGNIELI